MYNKNQFGDTHQLPPEARAGDWTLPWMNTSTSTLENKGCLCIIRTLKHLHSPSVQTLCSETHKLPAADHSAPWCPKAALYPARAHHQGEAPLGRGLITGSQDPGASPKHHLKDE